MMNNKITTRRNFIKSAGLLTAAAAFFNPAELFSQRRGSAQVSGSKKLTLKWLPFDALLKHPFTIAGFTRTTTPIVLTEISWDGYTGYGEASMPPYLGETQASAMEFLKKVDLSRFNNPFQIQDILAYVDSIAINNTAAKAAVDIALHDLVGKILGHPWWKIWGFNAATTPDTSFTIGLDTEEVVIQKTKEAMVKLPLSALRYLSRYPREKKIVVEIATDDIVRVNDAKTLDEIIGSARLDYALGDYTSHKTARSLISALRA